MAGLNGWGFNASQYNNLMKGLGNIGDAYTRSMNRNMYANLAAQQQSRYDRQQFRAKEAAKNRQWQEYMSNTAYQRAMADMKAAGLNPILAYSQGGATTPAGTSAGGYTISGAQTPVNGLAALLSSAPAIGESIAKIVGDGFTALSQTKEGQDRARIWNTASDAWDTLENMIDSMAKSTYYSMYGHRQKGGGR